MLSLLTVLALMVAAPPRPAGDIVAVPRLDQIVIDGKGEDWKGRGFSIEALAPVNGGLRSASDFSAQLRLGWDSRGLLVQVRVRDNVATEGVNPGELWQKDSVELFVGGRKGVRDWLQTLVGPGIDPATNGVRVHHDDHRDPKRPGRGPAQAQAAAAKTADGYILEARLPWKNLGIVPGTGRELAFQIVVNDVDGDGPRGQLMWFPEEGAYSDPAKMHRISLGAAPSPAVRVAALPDYVAFPRTRLALNAPASLAGQTVEARDAKGLLGWTRLGAAGGHAVGTLTLSRVPVGAATLTGAGALPLRDPDKLRQDALHAARLAGPFVFFTDALPAMELSHPERMDATIGQYALQTRFFDVAGNAVTRAAKPGRYGAVVTLTSANGKWRERRFVTLFRAPAPPEWNGWDGPVAPSLPRELGIDSEVVKNQRAAVSEYFKGAFFEGADSPETATLLAGLFEASPTDPPVQRLSPTERDRAWWFSQKRRLGIAPSYRYLARTPAGYDADPKKRWPLLLFLHGSGERGTDLALVRTHGPLKEAGAGRDLPFVIVAPQCPDGEWWSPVQLAALVDELEKKYRLDPERLYATGLSMGGFGTWALALAYPDRFAAIAPICGGGDPADAARLISVPIWNFHGARDAVVSPALSQAMIDALGRVGASETLYTVYPDAGHDSWTTTYANPKLYEWLLSHRRERNR